MGMSLRTQRVVTGLMEQTATRGLDQEGMDKLLVKYSDYDRRMLNRCMSVIKCWIAPAEYIQAPFAASEQGVAPIQMPGAFLWRVWFSHGRSSKGMLRASQTFLRFLRDVWMDAIYVDTVGDGLFVPEYFFKHPFEAKSFVQHVATFKN